MVNKYRVGIIGRTGKGDYGHGMDVVWRNVPHVEVVALADDNQRALAAAQRRAGAKTAYADYREMLERERPQIVGVAQRWVDQHHAMLLACADYGCHVFMEKPFCRTLEEADEIVRAFEMRHLKLAVAHTTRYCPVLTMAKKLIQNGEIGEVLEARARGKEDKRGGGEDFWVLGSHLVDLLRVFFGDPHSCWASVTVDGRPVAKADVIEGNEGLGPLAGDSVQASYGFSRNVVGYVGTRRNKAGSPSRFGVQIFGSKGVLEMLTGYLNPGHILKDPSWSPGRSGAKWQTFTSAGIDRPEPIKGEGHDAANIAGALDLIEAIEKDGQPQCSMYDGRWTIEMISGAFESHRLGQAVQFPLPNRKNPLSLLGK